MATQHVSVTPQTKIMQATKSYPQHATQPPQGTQVGALALGGVVVTRPPLTLKRRGLQLAHYGRQVATLQNAPVQISPRIGAALPWCAFKNIGFRRVAPIR